MSGSMACRSTPIIHSIGRAGTASASPRHVPAMAHRGRRRLLRRQLPQQVAIVLGGRLLGSWASVCRPWVSGRTCPESDGPGAGVNRLPAGACSGS
jgi:hypothetical protein